MSAEVKTIAVRVTPKASHNRIEAVTEDGEGPDYRVYVTAAPDKGKANKAVIALLAKELGVAKSTLTIVRGETSRDKLVEIRT